MIINYFCESSGQSPSISPIKDNRSMIVLFDHGWEFSFDEHNWINVSLPHTSRIEPIEKIEQQWQGICFYRKELMMMMDNSLHLILRFDAAMHEADVWINGQHISQHLGGYLPFDVNLPSTVNGRYQILVRLQNTDNSLVPPGKNLSSSET